MTLTIFLKIIGLALLEYVQTMHLHRDIENNTEQLEISRELTTLPFVQACS